MSASISPLHAWRERILRADAVVYGLERVLLLVSVTLMILLVFANVIQRTFSRPVGKTAEFANKLLALVSTPAESTVTWVETTGGPALFYVSAALFCIAATHTARGRIVEQAGGGEPAGVGKSAAIGLAIFLGGALSIWALLSAAPAGIPGAQKFALGFLVWSGLLGASLAARAKRHIVLDAILRKISGTTGLWFTFLSGTMTFLFCAALTYLSASKAWVEISEWSESGHTIHVFESAPIPVWVVTFALPAGFLVAGLRFLFIGLSTLLFGAMPESVDEHGVDFAALAREAEEAAAAGAGDAAADAAEAGSLYGRPHVADGGAS